MQTARSSRSPLSCLAVSGGWALLLGLGVLEVACGQDKGIGTSNDLANAIIERAKSSETVDLNWLGDKTCFVAESLYAPSFARQWFPGYGLRDNQYRDKSEGVWNIIVSNDKERIVRIYSIDQSTLRWNVPEETKIVDAVGCKSTVRVIVSGTSAEIIVF
jgi:hypothetical protein